MPEMSITGLVVDGVLLLLLGAVLYGCYRVNGRLRDMRDGQTELADLIGRLEKTTTQAREAVGELKRDCAEARDGLKTEVKRARALADELTLITEAGDNLASRLERRLTRPDDGEESPRSGRPEVLHALKEAR